MAATVIGQRTSVHARPFDGVPVKLRPSLNRKTYHKGIFEVGYSLAGKGQSQYVFREV